MWFHYDVADRRANVHAGDPLPDVVRRYVTCDADVRALIERNGVPMAISSKLRTVDDKLRAIVEHRDGGCCVPGCQQRRWLHIHHLIHWEDGGPTTPSNLCALCPQHHRLHHLGALQIRGSPGSGDGLRFFNQHGLEITALLRTPTTGPAPPPQRAYVHPSGEPVDWHWWHWRAHTDATRN